MTKRDPEMYRGLLEVVEMFRNRDKEGLKMYLQKFLPHMDDPTIEDFIIGGGGTEGSVSAGIEDDSPGISLPLDACASPEWMAPRTTPRATAATAPAAVAATPPIARPTLAEAPVASIARCFQV